MGTSFQKIKTTKLRLYHEQAVIHNPIQPVTVFYENNIQTSSEKIMASLSY
jgi:hypothetical protein